MCKPHATSIQHFLCVLVCFDLFGWSKQQVPAHREEKAQNP